VAIETERAERRTCEKCGGPDGLEVGGRWVCEACYSLSGSCCLEFGADDLWKDREGETEKGPPGVAPP
jgi:hypothetical protein